MRGLRSLDPAPPAIRRALALLLVSIAGMLLLADAASAKKKRVPKAPSDFFGVSAVRPDTSDFAGMAKLGVGTYRVEFAWPSIQRTLDGEFNWGLTDSRVAAAAANGLRIVPIVFGQPGFLSGDGSNIIGPVNNQQQRSEWQDFVEAVVARYRGGGTFWQENPGLNPRLAADELIVWNEQNARPFWWPKVSPKQYATLLEITRAAVDRVDPGLKLITGGMFGFPKDKRSKNAKAYLKQLYRRPGAKALIDGVSVHPYDGGLKGVKKQVKQIRTTIDRARDRKARLLIGEFGWSSGGSRKNEFVKSKRGQAKLLKQSVRYFLSKRKRWKIDSIYWFSYNDHDGDGFCLWCPKAGLTTKSGKLKPSGKAYRRIVKQSSK